MPPFCTKGEQCDDRSGYGKAQRSLEEPSSEPVIRGPRDGFIENISTNIGLITQQT